MQQFYANFFNSSTLIVIFYPGSKSILFDTGVFDISQTADNRFLIQQAITEVKGNHSYEEGNAGIRDTPGGNQNVSTGMRTENKKKHRYDSVRDRAAPPDVRPSIRNVPGSTGL
jgi:hypothetical protein